MDEPYQYCRDEFIDHTVYRELARIEKNGQRKTVLQRLSDTELEHYRYWSKHAGNYEPKVNHLRIAFVVVLSRLMGLTFTIKLLERHEEKTIQSYRKYLERLPEDDKVAVQSIIEQEQEHEVYFVSQLNEGVVKYMGFIVLGLADAIVEITGVHAGFLGVTNSTLMAGVAGLVVGLAAAIAMASASYLQAKHGLARNPLVSAITTGLAYIGAVALLALPYFLTHNMILAFSLSLAAAIFLTASFTFYGAVLMDKRFWREFVESLALVLGTALLTYLFGGFLGSVFGIRGAVKIF